MPKRHIKGIVTSSKVAETAMVTITETKRHPLYGKRYQIRKVFPAHNPADQYKVGDVVIIEEHKPISKTKHWIIKERLSTSEDLTAPIEAMSSAEVAAINPEETSDQIKDNEPVADAEQKL